ALIADEQQRFGGRAPDLVNLLDNHDTGRFASEAGNLAPDELQRRLRLGLLALLTLPGIPQLYTGDELGILGGNDPDNRRDMPAWCSTTPRKWARRALSSSPAATCASRCRRRAAACICRAIRRPAAPSPSRCTRPWVRPSPSPARRRNWASGIRRARCR